MKKVESLRRVTMMRYISPLREGGSLPALADADDGFKYVVKFKGSGHGVKAVIAELIGGEIAHVLGLKVPELVYADLEESFGRTEGDEEIQDLLKWSTGLNIGLHFLSGAVNYDPAVMKVDTKTASKIVWLDAFLTNIDRTARNTNMLMWKNELWLIDHGSSLYFHHSWNNWEEKAATPFALIKNHVLLHRASALEEINEFYKNSLTPEILHQVVDLLPEEWLVWEGSDQSPEEVKNVYKKFLILRLENADNFVKEAQDARRKKLI